MISLLIWLGIAFYWLQILFAPYEFKLWLHSITVGCQQVVNNTKVKKQYELISKKNLGNALPVVRIIKVIMARESFVYKEILCNKITIT
jgi:hypothetical protein